jgi:predicted enzyme related to lactoylglutathione lyase
MKKTIKFIHTNLIAKDWQKLAQFYIDVFGCIPNYPERDLSGDWMDKLTNIPDVHVKGIHLHLPGYKDGPTLEIFGYNKAELRDSDPMINTQGFGHIAFHVENIQAVLKKLLKFGGKKYGELVEKGIEGVGFLTVIYTTDPEGNIIELQNRRGMWGRI